MNARQKAKYYKAKYMAMVNMKSAIRFGTRKPLVRLERTFILMPRELCVSQAYYDAVKDISIKDIKRELGEEVFKHCAVTETFENGTRRIRVKCEVLENNLEYE